MGMARDALCKWVDAGTLTEEEAKELRETLTLLDDLVDLGAVPGWIADAIVDDLAEEQVAVFVERSLELVYPETKGPLIREAV